MAEKTLSKKGQDESDLGPDAFYFSALKGGKFLIQACDDCGKHVFYPRVVCPHCGGKSLSWVSPSGLGTVYSTTYMTRKPADGGDYNVSIVRLDEGVQMMSRVDKVAPADVAIGMRVSAVVRVENDNPIVVFEPVEKS